jgi:hypothetical protein
VAKPVCVPAGVGSSGICGSKSLSPLDLPWWWSRLQAVLATEGFAGVGPAMTAGGSILTRGTRGV